ncbi:MAG: family 16 glycoside hydrolase [Phycisphaerae bacterium]
MRTTHFVSLAFAVLVAVTPARAQSATKAAAEPGLCVMIYELDRDVASIPELARGEPPSAILIAPTLNYRDGGFGEFKDHFATHVLGSLNIETAGDYAFRLSSDDGSRLWIDGRLIVDHDGLHGATPPMEAVAKLDAGQHQISIWHFENTGGEALTLEWKPPGATDFTLIPADRLSHAPPNVKAAPGPKHIIPALRRGHPGDGRPVAGVHPGYTIVEPDRGARFAHGLGGYRYAALRFLDKPDPAAAKAAIWMPPTAAGFSSVSVLTLGAKGDERGQMLVAPYGAAGVWRAYVEPAGDAFQGCVLQFSQGLSGSVKQIHTAGNTLFLTIPDLAPTGPDGKAGEQALQNNGKIAFELSHVEAQSNGLILEFTKELDPRCGWEADSYYIEQWPFSLAEKDAAAPARDGVVYPVKSASVLEGNQRIFLEIDGLKPSHVIYLRLLPPCISKDGDALWSTESWYTMLQLPADRSGKPAARPPQPEQNVLSEQEKKDGWRLLFDGHSTAGWRGFRQTTMPVGRDGRPGWSVVDGALVRTGPGGDIVSEDEFDSFELKLDWRISPAGNSGIFFHVSEDPKYKYVFETGPEMQILDNSEHADGHSLLTSAGSNYALHAPPRDVTQPIGFYNQVRMQVDGKHVEYWLNGEKMCEYEMGDADWEKRVTASKFAQMPGYGRSPTGRIALQDHGDKVWFRNIKIRPLPKK